MEGRENETPQIRQDDNLSYHTDNWLECMRSRKRPHGSIETGFAHAVAVVMATSAYPRGKEDVLGQGQGGDCGLSA